MRRPGDYSVMLGLRSIGLLLLVLGLVQAAVPSRSSGLKQRSVNSTTQTSQNAKSLQHVVVNVSTIHHVPGTSMTLHFSEGGEDLPVKLVQSCLLKAMTWVAQQVSFRPDAAMNYRTFRQKPILLKIYPKKVMSTSTCAKILAAWSEFIAKQQRAFATQMTITDGDSGFLGYMEISNDAPGSDLSAASNTSSVQLVKPGDGAAGLILDGSANNSLTSARPPNEYKVRLAETTYVRLQLNNYGQDLPSSDFLAVLLDIQMTVIQHIIISGGGSYVGEVQRWHAGGVKFQVVPLRMTWLTLAELVEAIHTKVVEPFGTFEFDFEVTYNGPRGNSKLGVGFCRQQQR